MAKNGGAEEAPPEDDLDELESTLSGMTEAERETFLRKLGQHEKDGSCITNTLLLPRLDPGVMSRRLSPWPNSSQWAAPFSPVAGIKRTQLVRFLGVNQQTVDRLLEVEQRYTPRRRQLTNEMKMDYERLMQIMSKPSPSDQDVKAIITSMKRKKQEMQDLQNRQGDEEEALLTPVQQALYLMYQRRLLQEARSVKGHSPGETAPFNPAAPGGSGFAAGRPASLTGWLIPEIRLAV